MTDLDLPFISIITPSFNQGRFIEQTIQSVLSQDYPSYEHIVIDGGSTDDTVSILKRYSHLTWSSEPDRGQSHAINKGFRRAHGDILCWINSDDWLAPGALRRVAEGLRDYQVLFGACGITDVNGDLQHVIMNHPRGFFDVLKYWVSYSVPTLSIFFRREIMEAVKLPDGDYIDESLEFGMDYELLLRVGTKEPFLSHSQEPLTFCRMYEDNKTGGHMAASYRECSQVYKRYTNICSQPDCTLSMIVPVQSEHDIRTSEIDDLVSQGVCDTEILFLDNSGDPQIFRAIRRAVVELNKQNCPIFFRAVHAHHALDSLPRAIDFAVQVSRGKMVSLCSPWDRWSSVHWQDLLQCFQIDSVGIVIPFQESSASYFGISEEGHTVLQFDRLLSETPVPTSFIARKTLLQDLGGLRWGPTLEYAIRELIMRSQYKGWSVRLFGTLEQPRGLLTQQRESPFTVEEWQRMGCQLVVNLDDELKGEPFGGVRVNEGYGVEFPEHLVNEARRALVHSQDLDVDYPSVSNE